eukprot:4227947-Pyramimonas_sp.AAC.2
MPLMMRVFSTAQPSAECARCRVFSRCCAILRVAAYGQRSFADTLMLITGLPRLVSVPSHAAPPHLAP